MKTIAYVFMNEYRRNLVRHNIEFSMGLKRNLYEIIRSADDQLEVFFLRIDQQVVGLRFDIIIFDDNVKDEILKHNFIYRLRPKDL